MLGPPKNRHFDRQLLVSLENLVPSTNFYRHLDAKLDLSFVRGWVADCYAERGRPSIDPVVFFKLQLILFFEGLRSERRLIETASLHLAHRWYLGYDLDEPLPDHSSLTRIRQRLGLAVFERFFEHVIELCQQAGLVWGKELFIDATKVRANADVDSLVPRFYQRAKEHLQELFADDGEARAAEAEEAAVENEAAVVAVDLHPPTEDEEQRLAAENQATWKLLDEHRLDPGRPVSGSYQRMTDLRVSTTDPDAVPMRARNGAEVRLGYHDHYVVDGGKARIILSAFVTPADVMENQAMVDLVQRVRFRWQLHPKRVVGDTAYGTAATITALETQGIRAYTPLPDWDARTPFYGTARFTYDASKDEYRCPEGQPLRRRKAKYTDAVIVY